MTNNIHISSKQQIVSIVAIFIETPITLNFEEVLKKLKVFEMVLLCYKVERYLFFKQWFC